MKKYKTIQQVTLTAGVLELSKDQARRRRHLIQEVPDRENVYEILNPCHFKVGEEFGYEGFDMTPVLAQCFEGEEKALQKKRAAEKKAGGKKIDESKKSSGIKGFFADLFGKKSDEELADDEKAFVELVNAIERIDPENKDLWTQNRGPKLAALRDATGNIGLTEDQRDSAWETYEKKKEIEAAQGK